MCHLKSYSKRELYVLDLSEPPSHVGYLVGKSQMGIDLVVKHAVENKGA